MPPGVPNWWTDERVAATVTREYVYAKLRVDEQELLKQSPSFAAGLTDDTYLEWILTKARRFFLVLVDAAVPDQIFGIVDDSWDDGDLPIAEESVPDLRLSYQPSQALNKRFYKSQYRYLLRVLEDGEHIRYADEEIVPVYASGLKATILSLGKDGVDKVRLSASTSRYFVRKKIPVDHRPNGISETLVLTEIASLKRYAHPHILSVFASYLQHDSMYVLFTPPTAYSLKSFLNDLPKAFGVLPKTRRRQTLLNWLHCLASALRWLHANGRHHGAIRPSNIQVDDDFNVCLGQFDDPGVLGTYGKLDDIESYQYAAPERWKRAVTMQTTAPSKVMGASGGRTARRIKPDKLTDDTSAGRSPRSSWSAEQRRVDTMNPTSTTYSFLPKSRGNFSRLQLSKSNDTSLLSDGVSTTIRTRANTVDRHTGSPYSSQHKNTSNTRWQIPSSLSYTSSTSDRTIKAATKNSSFAAGPEVKTAVVQTWHSAQHDLLAADMFSMGAVLMDIMTLLCKKSAGSFARHRSAKNRNAGRGGGLADASFHANIGQVVLWGTQLQAYAAGRTKKDDSEIFKALGQALQLAKRCLERDPEERLNSVDLKRGLGDYISISSPSTELHCAPEPVPASKKQSSSKTISETNSTTDQTLAPTIEDYPPHMSGALPTGRRDEWSQLRSRGLTTSTIPSPGPDTSLSSLSSFNFEYEVQSDTVVAEDKSTNSDATHATEPYLATRNWQNWHSNDSNVDPKLMQYPDSSAFKHADYSASDSSEDAPGHEGKSFLLPPTRPSSMYPAPTMQPPAPPPTRALPAAPISSKNPNREKETMAPYQSRSSSAQSKQVVQPQVLDEDDFHALSLQNAEDGKKRRQMLGKGKSFLKNL